MSTNLRSKTVRALGQLGAGGAMGKLVSLTTTLVLARILSPADYGLMALAMVVIGFVGFFNEVGIGSAIVQKEDLEQDEVNGCFAIAILISLVLCGATALASPLVAMFFGDARLAQMIPLLSTAFVVGATGSIPMAFLRREMRFGAIAIVNILAILIQSGVALYLAYHGHGVWSLVWGYLVANAVQSIGYCIASSWRPRGAFALRKAFGIVGYGLHVTSTRIFWYAYTNADKVIVGKLLGDRALGIYDMAYSLATLPISQITGMVNNVAFPLFARLQNDMQRMSSVILKLTRGLAYVTYPALIGMLAVSRELVAVVLGPKWIDILIPFGALCLMGLVKSVDPLLSQVLIATGHARKLSAYTLMCGIAMTIGVIVGAIADGLRGVALVWVLVYPVLSVKLLSDTCDITGMKVGDYYRNLLPVLGGVAAMAAVVLLVREGLLTQDAPLALMLAVEIVAGALAYFMYIVYVDRRGITEIRQVLVDMGIAEKRLSRWPFSRALTAG
jgi:O-antigen/teichoic acid export membrane protein